MRNILANAAILLCVLPSLSIADDYEVIELSDEGSSKASTRAFNYDFPRWSINYVGVADQSDSGVKLEYTGYKLEYDRMPTDGFNFRLSVSYLESENGVYDRGILEGGLGWGFSIREYLGVSLLVVRNKVGTHGLDVDEEIDLVSTRIVPKIFGNINDSLLWAVELSQPISQSCKMEVDYTMTVPCDFAIGTQLKGELYFSLSENLYISSSYGFGTDEIYSQNYSFGIDWRI